MISKGNIILFILGSTFTTVGCNGNSSELDPMISSVQKTKTRSADGMVMVFVPEAAFKVSENGKGGAGTHEVRLNSFWIDQTEITNSNYRQCVEGGVCAPPDTCAWGEPTYNDPSYNNHPVICVTQEMVNTYCECAGGRLPTEAEWDYAARGSERTSFTWGDAFIPENLNFCDKNCPKVDSNYKNFDDGYEQTAPVGFYPDGASWCGAMDMNGNVWEWVADWYAPYTQDAQENPQGPSTGVERVIRGGSWYDNPDFLRADHRHPFNPTDFNHLIGFRCVLPNLKSDQ
jgi:formylglycine-generating enzyme required for sulfatase activity